MKVKRFEGKNEEQLMEQIREEMGPNATVVSTREKPYPLPLGWFMRPKIVITAAYEDEDIFNFDDPPTPPTPPAALPSTTPASASILEAARKALPSDKKETTEESIEESLALLLQEARKATLKTETEEAEKPKPAPKQKKKTKSKEEPPAETTGKAKYKNPLVQTIYETLLSQDVLPEVADRLLVGVAQLPPNDKNIRDIVKSVYSSIVEMLSNPRLIDPESNSPRTIVFMGPTGVGKTTTIAKLSSMLTLKHNKKIGLATADTYRIAAVEQLRTYADILGLDIRTVYSPEEMATQVEALSETNDIILVDTAGRSHRNKENLAELKATLDQIPDSLRYLVLSVTTRYRDLGNIVDAYNSVTDFTMIFTKLDEADSLGNLVNLCCLTGKRPAYITFGQSVPEDFDAIRPDTVAKSLLGLSNETAFAQPEETAIPDATPEVTEGGNNP